MDGRYIVLITNQAERQTQTSRSTTKPPREGSEDGDRLVNYVTGKSLLAQRMKYNLNSQTQSITYASIISAQTLMKLHSRR